jgi:hypothetical protein
LVGPVDCNLHDNVELEVVDAFVVTAIAVRRMASVMLLLTSFDTALTTPSFAPMTD